MTNLLTFRVSSSLDVYFRVNSKSLLLTAGVQITPHFIFNLLASCFVYTHSCFLHRHTNTPPHLIFIFHIQEYMSLYKKYI